MKCFFLEMWRSARQGPRIYFAPVRGFVAGIRQEWARLEAHQQTDDPSGA
jgi:hypothetical protein